MSGDDLLDVIGGVYAPDIQRPVLALERSYTAHVVAVIGVLVASEAVDV